MFHTFLRGKKKPIENSVKTRKMLVTSLFLPVIEEITDLESHYDAKCFQFAPV